MFGSNYLPLSYSLDASDITNKMERVFVLQDLENGKSWEHQVWYRYSGYPNLNNRGTSLQWLNLGSKSH